ncbi:MAG TPA: homoserine kinase [Acidobacteriota bacterium]|jgi:homoserine kinase
MKGNEIAVPASIANLGPGFDTLAVAVELYLRLHIAAVSPDDGDSLEFEFVDQKLEGENYIERAFRFLADASGKHFPSLHIQVRSEIPMRAGLGSSAAATVAGLKLFEKMTRPLSTSELLSAASGLEGHPDNVSAALLGGLTASCRLADGTVNALQSRWPESIRFVVLTPEIRLKTSDSRSVLPEAIRRRDAVFNLQRVAMLLLSLQREDYQYLREALRDRWHQPYRDKLIPGLKEALALDHPDLLGVCLSGSGPSIVALAERNFPKIEELLAQSYGKTGIPFSVRTLAVHQQVAGRKSQVEGRQSKVASRKSGIGSRRSQVAGRRSDVD